MAVVTEPKPPVNTTTAYPAGTSQTDINAQVASQENLTPASNARPGERNMDLETQNREKMLTSGELKADTNPQLAQEKINLFTYGVENPVFGAATSSDPTREKLANDTKMVNDQLASITDEKAKVAQSFVELPQPEYKTYTDYTQEYEQGRIDNKQLYEKAKETIAADFAIREQEQRSENRVRSGFQAKQLARMNALGTGTSGISFLQQVDVQNQQQLNKLLVQKEQVLLQAAQAAQANDLELLNKLVAESHAVTDQYNKIQSQRLSDSIATNTQLMEQNRFGWDSEDRAAKKLSDLASIGTTYEQSPDEIAQLEQDAGLPNGYYQNLFTAVEEQKAMAEEEDELTKEKMRVDMQGSINEIRNNTPEGQSFKIGDIVYTGWQKDKPVWQATETDDNGNVTLLYYDSKTGEYKTVGLGNIGSTNMGVSLVPTADGLYTMDKLGNTKPLMTSGGYMDPGNIDGFDSWLATMGNVTTPFGTSTQHALNQGGGEASHPGYDIAPPGARAGQHEVTAFLPPNITGTVIQVHDTPNDNPYGRYVVVQDSEGRTWQYSHLATTDVTVGAEVSSGTYLGQMGNTGNVFSTSGGDGTHLDLRVKTPDKIAQSPASSGAGTQAERAAIETTKAVQGQTYAPGSDEDKAQALLMNEIKNGRNVPIDAQVLAGLSRQYASTGVFPSQAPTSMVGIIQKMAAELPKPDGTLVDINTGVKSSKVGKEQEDGYAAGYDLVQSMDDLKAAFDAIPFGRRIPQNEKWQSDAETKYLAKRTATINKLLKMMSGLAVTEFERDVYEKMLPNVGWNWGSEVKMDEFKNNVTGILNSKLQTQGLKMVGYGETPTMTTTLTPQEEQDLNTFDKAE